MTSSSPVNVPLLSARNLGKRQQLAQGKESVVYDLPDYVGDDGHPVVLKWYKKPVDPDGLARIATWLAGLDPALNRTIASRVTIPLKLVTDARNDSWVRGVLLPRVPQNFFVSIRGVARAQSRPAEIQHVFATPATNLAVAVQTPSHPERVRLCWEAAESMALLHENGLVYGDVSGKNLVFTLEPQPAVIFLEGDGLIVLGSAYGRAFNTPDWFPPEGAQQPTLETDRYKLALLVLRVLATSPRASIATDPAVADEALDEQGRSMLRSGLSPHPDDRPSATKWARYFGQKLTGRSECITLDPVGGIRGRP